MQYTTWILSAIHIAETIGHVKEITAMTNTVDVQRFGNRCKENSIQLYPGIFFKPLPLRPFLIFATPSQFPAEAYIFDTAFSGSNSMSFQAANSARLASLWSLQALNNGPHTRTSALNGIFSMTFTAASRCPERPRRSTMHA
ncbi:hypothetical protein IEQ34_017591 [Dendrobium chrysotoxum]|uniref:Uncharacterized protein n=1 Tax=Dendrobium chrysotoxum TaxID=161865 RepID=A0AAV7GAK7_DENCH|nr:hypothetical protein IEQ34_017591 [Dendrobium chrysotoxum]